MNIAAKGITGFDSPMLANSLKEAAYNYQSISQIITIYKDGFNDKSIYEEWMSNLKETITILEKGDFDSFDRYGFIKNHTNNQLALVNKTADDWGVELNKSRELNPNAENLFSKDFLNLEMYAYQKNASGSKEQIKLGKVLFNDASLSQNKNMSCASCHLANKAFTDGNPKALGIDGEAVAGPGLGTIILNYKFKSSSVKERALYLNEQLQLPEDERVLSIEELDAGQVMHKPGKL